MKYITILFLFISSFCTGQVIEDYTSYFEGIDSVGNQITIDVTDTLTVFTKNDRPYYTFTLRDSTYVEDNQREFISYAGENLYNWIFYYNEYYTYGVIAIVTCWCDEHNGDIIHKEIFVAPE